jgi:putative tryptophan/tyrosine transport system substrate-binding protein
MILRREFIAGLGSVAAWPVVARAQQGDRVRRIGVLTFHTESDPLGQVRIATFRQALREFGWTEGRNVRFDIRFGGGDADRYVAYAAELVDSHRMSCWATDRRCVSCGRRRAQCRLCSRG